MTKKTTAQEAANGFENLNETVSDAVRALSAKAVRASAESLELMNSEGKLAIDAASAISGSKSAEEAFRAGSDYFTAFASRVSERVKAAIDEFPKHVSETAVPVEAVANSFRSAFNRQ